MKTTIKAYFEGGYGYLNSHKETRQLAENGEYFVDDKRSALVRMVCLMFSQNAEIDPSLVFDVYDGKTKEYRVAPGNVVNGELVPCHFAVDELTGKVVPENLLIIRKSSAGFSIEESKHFSEYKASIRIAAMDIEDTDVAYGVVASYYRAQVDGNTVDMFLHELFSTREEAEAFLEEVASNQLCPDASLVEVSVFSRSHIEQTRWYRKSLEDLSEETDEHIR